jgi:hypothetical protein
LGTFPSVDRPVVLPHQPLLAAGEGRGWLAVRDYLSSDSGGFLHTGIAWDIVFSLINLQKIYRLRAEDQPLKHMADAQLLPQGVLSSLKPVPLARLVTGGYMRRLEAGWVLATSGE